jgi:hypothetical protein
MNKNGDKMMNSKTFLTTHSVIYIVFAIALFFVPQFIWPMYGVELNDKYAYFLSQHNSIFLGGLGVLSWLLRDIEEGTTAKKLFLAFLIMNLLGVMITVYAGMIGIFVGFGWSDPVFFTVLAILSYFQYSKQ